MYPACPNCHRYLDLESAKRCPFCNHYLQPREVDPAEEAKARKDIQHGLKQRGYSDKEIDDFFNDPNPDPDVYDEILADLNNPTVGEIVAEFKRDAKRKRPRYPELHPRKD